MSVSGFLKLISSAKGHDNAACNASEDAFFHLFPLLYPLCPHTEPIAQWRERLVIKWKACSNFATPTHIFKTGERPLWRLELVCTVYALKPKLQNYLQPPRNSNIGALIFRIGFWGPLHYTYNKGSPPKQYRQLFRPPIVSSATRP